MRTRKVRSTPYRAQIPMLCKRQTPSKPATPVTFQILSLPSRRRIPQRALDSVVPAVAGFLERPNTWVKHASLTLLHRMASGNDLGGVLRLVRGSK